MCAAITRRDLLRWDRPQDRHEADDVHIASLLLRIVPDRLDAVQAVIATIPQAELHPTEHPARYAVLLEACDERALADATTRLSDTSGVLTVAIVTHVITPAASLDEAVT
jgi:nitrate reductase NapAB chaperone NapD